MLGETIAAVSTSIKLGVPEGAWGRPPRLGGPDSIGSCATRSFGLDEGQALMRASGDRCRGDARRPAIGSHCSPDPADRMKDDAR